MLSTPLRLPIKLLADFPKLLPGHYHQLTTIGNLRQVPDFPLNRTVDTYFQCVKPEQQDYVPVGAPFMRPINIHQAASLQTGTLLTSNGEVHLYSQAAVRSSLDFALGPGVELTSTTLEIVLPELSSRRAYGPLRTFLADPILRSLRQLPVSVLTAPSGEVVIIPQFELARAFYFWAGAKFIDFLFHPTRVSHICDPLQAPRAANNWSGKVLIRPSTVDPGNVFLPASPLSPEQVLLLAQMRFSTRFRQAAEQLQARQALAASTGKIAPISFDLALSQRAAVSASGLAFTYREQPYFWVCSIFKRSNYFCFDQLHYTTLVDHRSASMLAPGASPSPQPQGGISTHLNIQNQPSQDSNQQGDSSYGGPDVELPTGETLDLPTVSRNAKVVQQALYRGGRKHRYGIPQVLTQRGGGRDLSVAKVNLRPAWESIDSYEYFHTIIEEFTRLGYTVARLQVNNPASAFGWGFSVPAGTKKGDVLYLVGIACVQQQVGKKRIYGYFFHVLYSKSRRSAFLYRTDLAPLTDEQLNWLLKTIRKWGDDWVKTREEYEAKWKEKVTSLLQNGIRLPLILHARNHKKATQVVELCVSELKHELSLN